MHWAFIVLIVVASLILILFTFALICHFIGFGRRCDINPLLKYYSAEDFGLVAELVECDELKGFIYTSPNVASNEKLIIFCHGMGPGQVAYTTEIAHFCELGCTVLALDSRGCNFSAGKSVKGMYSGVKTVVAAIDYAYGRKEFEHFAFILVGHSWGAYSVLCATTERGVDSVIAISAPDTPSKAVEEALSRMISPPFAAVLRPFVWLVNFFMYGPKGNASASRRIVKSGVHALVVHGDNDKIVSIKNSAFDRAEGDEVEKYIVNGKAHNPYNTVEAEQKLAELSGLLKKASKMTEEEKQAFYMFDYQSATQEDSEVMRVIDEFISRV